MATPMLSVLHKTRASLDAERTARAQGAARAARGYFAAFSDCALTFGCITYKKRIDHVPAPQFCTCKFLFVSTTRCILPLGTQNRLVPFPAVGVATGLALLSEQGGWAPHASRDEPPLCMKHTVQLSIPKTNFASSSHSSL